MAWPLLIQPITHLLDKFIADKDEKNKLAHQIATMSEQHAHALSIEQIKTNQMEATHRSVLVAGWRPFIGWTCGLALAWHFVFAPITLFVVAFNGWVIPTLPVFDMNSLLTVLLGMLGLGGLRSFEKYKGLTK